MRKSPFLACLILSVLYPLIAPATEKVVIIPLLSSKKINNVITVATSGGDYANPILAINSINDAAIDNPYLILIGPGTYNIDQPLLMKDYVSLSGAGIGTTVLSGSISSNVSPENSAVVVGANNSKIEDLTIINLGGNGISIGIYNGYSSSMINNVQIESSGTKSNYGIYNFHSGSTIKNSEISVSGNGDLTKNVGIFNSYSGTINLLDLNIKVSSTLANQNYGINNDFSNVIMRNIISDAFGASSNFAIATSFGSCTLTNVEASAILEPTNNNYGLTDTQTSAVVRRSTISGSTFAVYSLDPQTTTTLTQSTIDGGVTGTGTKVCIASDDGNGNALISDCSSITPP